MPPPRAGRLAAALAAAVMLLPASAAAASGPPAAQVSYFGHTALLRTPGITHLPRTHLPRPVHAVSNAAGAAQVDSRNWSGYADAACTTCRLRYVEDQFALPSVNCTGVSGTRVTSLWAGLDGLTSATVEQIGVDGFCSGTTPSYVAWYEMYPAPPVVLSLPVQPGDALDASVFFNAAGGDYSLTLDDITRAVGAGVTASCPAGSTCANTSAEVIAEAPFDTGTSSFVPLADFGRAFFTGGRVTSLNGTRGGLGTTGLWTAEQVFMFNGASELAAPGPLVSGTAAGIPVSDFGVGWLAAS